ncbi:MAG TPA: DNA sulfur modification protein DndB [Candidatus Babeliaceae bacterium]|nr:DNA sulfur modification protein DndB [Candidatus Babeliaceae bacterium]
MVKLRLGALKGTFGDWVYFATTLKVKDVADQRRIETVSESEHLFTKNINGVLQREIEPKRINRIAQYLIQKKDRFLPSMIIAIYRGNPEWADIKVESTFKVDNQKLSDEDIFYLDGRLGVLTLGGTERMFVLDGQHRLQGIRKAYNDQPDKLGNDDVSVTIVVHNENLKERTRRLFTVLNRYAEKPKKAELIIMEEDDAAAILTRRLVLEYDFFKYENALSKSKGMSMPPSDVKSFTTLVCVYEINKVLIDYNLIHPKKFISRPTDDELGALYTKKIIPFWDFFLKKFPQISQLVLGKLVDEDVIRNKRTGGSLLFRPEGQLLIAKVYKQSDRIGRLKAFKDNIGKIDFNLSGSTLNYVFWKGDKFENKNQKLKETLFNFLLGNNDDANYITRELTKVYKDYNLKYTGHIKPVKN